MGNRPLQFRKAPMFLVGVASLLCLSTPAIAQSSTAPQGTSAQSQNSGVNEKDLAEFDRFLDSHKDIAAQIQKQPWIVATYQFQQDHPDLKSFLQSHPDVNQAIGQNPVAFMQDEQQFEKGFGPEAAFDRYLDSHRDVANDLAKKPWLANDYNYLQQHPDLKTFLQEHPAVQQGLNQNASEFMQKVQVYENSEGNQYRDEDARNGQGRDFDRDRDRDANGNRGDNDRDRDNDQNGQRAIRTERAEFDRFLESHPEIAEQVRKNPSLLDNRKFIEDHPAYKTFLQQNPGIRDQIEKNPEAFLRPNDNNATAENRGQGNRDFDRDRDANANNGNNRDQDRDRDANANDRDRDRDANAGNTDRDRDNDRDRDTNHGGVNRTELAEFDRFLDSHKEIAEQLRKDPSLLDNKQFIKSHPPLESFLQQNPAIRQQVQTNAVAFMQDEERFDRIEDGQHNTSREHAADFGQFLDKHNGIAKDVNKNPDVVKNKQYVQNHPELDKYLAAHPDVRDELMQNPHSFVKSAQQPATTTGTSTNGSGSGTTGTGTTNKDTTGATGSSSTKSTTGSATGSENSSSTSSTTGSSNSTTNDTTHKK